MTGTEKQRGGAPGRIAFAGAHLLAGLFFIALFSALMFQFLHPDGSRFELTLQTGVFRPAVACAFIAGLFTSIFAAPVYGLAWLIARILRGGGSAT